MKNLKKGLLVMLAWIMIVQDAGSAMAAFPNQTNQKKSFFRVEGKAESKKAVTKAKTASSSNLEIEREEEQKEEKHEKPQKATNSDAKPEIKPSNQEKNPEKEKPSVIETETNIKNEAAKEEQPYHEETVYSIAKESTDLEFAFKEKKIKGCVGQGMYFVYLLSYSGAQGKISSTSSDTSVVQIRGSELETMRMYFIKEGKAEIETVLTLETGEQKKTTLTVEVVKHQIKFTTNENPIRIPLGKAVEIPVDKEYLGYHSADSMYCEVEDNQIMSVFISDGFYKIRGQKLGKTTLTLNHWELTESREVEVYTDIQLGDISVEKNFPGAVELSWTMKNTPYYRVERAQEGDKFRVIFEGEDGELKNHYIDHGLVPGTQYRYRISAMAADEDGADPVEAYTKEVVVNVSEKEIKFKNGSISYLYTGETYLLETEYIGYDGEKVPAASWSSSNPEIVRVDNQGNVTGVKEGRTQITVRLEDGNEQTHEVSVYKAPEIEELNIATNYNQYIKLDWLDKSSQKAYIIYRRENNGKWEKLEEKTDIGFIDKTALSGHTYQYKITVLRTNYTNNHMYETPGTIIDVRVSERSVRLLADIVQVRKGEILDLPVEITGFAEPPLLKCTSSNEDVAKVNAKSKKITITGEGRADIAIEFPEGLTLQCTYFCVERPKNLCTKTEWQVFTLTNQNRMNEGHEPLSMFTQMQKATDIRKNELVQFFSHDRPNGKSCFSVFDEIKLNYFGAGENIAYGYETPENVVNGWMNSPGHYQNIMGQYTHFAAGETRNRWVQMFIGCGNDDLMAMAPADGSRIFKKGTKIEDFGEIVVLNCKTHGNVFMPLLSSMCTGYDADTPGEQTITVHYKDKTTTFTVTIKDSGTGGSNSESSSGGSSGGSSSGGSSGGGSSGGSSSGGGSKGGSSRGSNSGGGPGAVSNVRFVPVLTGLWIKNNVGWWLEMVDKTYPKDQWAQINGAIYRFNAYGYMVEGWFAEGGKWYYLMPGSGAMATGWIKTADTWYYLNPDGTMAVGWIQDAGKWYYLGADGAMLSNTITPDNYIVGPDGAWIP